MPAVVWTKKYETGLPKIDQQHKDLFQAINDLGEAFRYGDVQAQVEKSMTFLLGFTAAHLQEEEAWLRAIDYPELAKHQQEHASLMTQLMVLKRKADAGEHMTREVATYLLQWFAHHVEVDDMAYMKYAQGLGLGEFEDGRLPN